MRHQLIGTALLLFVCVVARPVAGQTADAVEFQAPAHVALVEGAVTVDHEGRAAGAVQSQPLVPGDRLHTADGRAEVILSDGSFLYVAEHSAIDVLSETLLRLGNGRVTLFVLKLGDATQATTYQVDTPAASIRTVEPGEYRVIAIAESVAHQPQTTLSVVRGLAQLASDQGAMMVRAGERSVVLEGLAPGLPRPFNSARFDAFDQWTLDRQGLRFGSASAQYLPSDVQMYSSAFDQYGSWGVEPAYGNVWYPTVAPTWRPYYNGYWNHYRPYGWTWIGGDP
jgi:hypothetical protein